MPWRLREHSDGADWTDTYEDLTPASLEKLLDDLAAGTKREARAAEWPSAFGSRRRVDFAHRQVPLQR